MVKKAQKYFEGVGRRKTAIARVRVYPESEKAVIMVNNLVAKEYFGTPELLAVITAPLRATGTEKDVKVDVHAMGGGPVGQTMAIQLGLSRALVKMNSEHHQTLRDLDFLKRDPRKKERKKPGLKKARRAPQWAKR